jgi:hypothetical protein
MKTPISLLLLLLALTSCQRDINDYFPKITTLSATVQPDGSVLVEGTVEDEGGAALRYLGFCCSTNPEPQMLDRQVLATFDGVNFTAVYEGGFDPDSVYHFRSWAANGNGWVYGNTVSTGNIIGSPVTPPCTLSGNSLDLGTGQGAEQYFQIGAPYSVPGGWVFTAATFSGPTVEFRFPELMTTKVYQTVGHNSPGPGEVFVSFYSGFISGALSPGSKVYVNRINEADLFEIVICDGEWEYGSGSYLLNTRLLVSF